MKGRRMLGNMGARAAAPGKHRACGMRDSRARPARMPVLALGRAQCKAPGQHFGRGGVLPSTKAAFAPVGVSHTVGSSSPTQATAVIPLQRLGARGAWRCRGLHTRGVPRAWGTGTQAAAPGKRWVWRARGWACCVHARSSGGMTRARTTPPRFSARRQGSKAAARVLITVRGRSNHGAAVGGRAAFVGGMPGPPAARHTSAAHPRGGPSRPARRRPHAAAGWARRARPWGVLSSVEEGSAEEGLFKRQPVAGEQNTFGQGEVQ